MSIDSDESNGDGAAVRQCAAVEEFAALLVSSKVKNVKRVVALHELLSLLRDAATRGALAAFGDDGYTDFKGDTFSPAEVARVIWLVFEQMSTAQLKAAASLQLGSEVFPMAKGAPTGDYIYRVGQNDIPLEELPAYIENLQNVYKVLSKGNHPLSCRVLEVRPFQCVWSSA